MRADRLVATLLLLQRRGRVTVAEVAAELETSERTARRDLEALAASGVPLYSQRGRGGGWTLVGGARTTLNGLTTDEIRALFLTAGPVADSPGARTVLRKLVQALPAPQREGAEAAARGGVADPTDWSRAPVGAAGPHLEVLRRAVVEGEQVRLGYATPGRPARERTVHPLGLASKAGVGYLVAGTPDGLRSYRLSRVTGAVPTGEPVDRPADFDLGTAWRTLTARMDRRLHAATVLLRAAPGTEALLERLGSGRVREVGELPDGWRELEVDGPSPEVVAAWLAGLGARIEVLAPPQARAELARIGAELTARYGEGGTGPGEEQ
ncbi:helix-turn-helix transcriptional regulator [Kitasatospora sp. NPDC096147]|uniref:helix-turn-helix transcriptional regulator n=1 Tax=Kitasatospora sp. NPDC096147 TaxID=3364093 RepID=UPI0038222536